MTKIRLTDPAVTEESRTFPGDTRQVGAARQFVARALAGCPARESLLTCVTELAANAVKHTDSGAGGTFTVTAGRPRDGVAFVAVADEGGPEDPVGDGAGEPGAGELAESGRGLALVDALSSRWGWRRTARGRVVWAESTWPVAVRDPGNARRGAPGLRGETWRDPLEPRGAA